MKKVRNNTLQPDLWFSKYYDYLYNYAKARIADSYIIEELIQEAFLACLKSMPNFKDRCTERTWITSILRNKIVDHYRNMNSKKGRIEKSTISTDEYLNKFNREIAVDEFDTDDIVKQLCFREFEKEIHAHIDVLPKKQAAVFRMCVIEGYNTEVVSEKLNISRNNVWVLMSRAKKSLSQSLEPLRYAI